jgi:flagellar hook capping protein FlgD
MISRAVARWSVVLALHLMVRPIPVDALGRGDDTPVCTAPGFQSPDAIVPDGAGGAIIAWYDRRSGKADIYAQHVRAAGKLDPSWPENGRALCLATGERGQPVMATDGAGGAIVAWHDYRSGDCDHCGDIYVQHVLASGAVDPAWPTDGRALCTAAGGQVFPAIVADGNGGAIVTWSDSRGGNSDVYAQRVLGSGEVDPGWLENGRALCTAPENQYPRAIVTDGAGGAIVVWTDGRNEEDADVYAQHVLATGLVDRSWPADGQAVRSAPGEQDNPVMVVDGVGGAIVVWTDAHRGPDGYYTGTYDLYAQHVLAAGQLDRAWPLSGLAVCTADDDQLIGGITSDRSGGAIVAWQDLRSGRRDIYAQHVLAGGVVDAGWPADGQSVCTAPPGDRDAPAIAPDGTGGAIIAWIDRRLANDDVYAQHVRGSGTLQPSWPTDGRAVCAAAGSQIETKVVADGARGALIIWRDYRSGDADIYARSLHGSNAVSLPRPRPIETFHLHPFQPRMAGGALTIVFDLPVAQSVTLELFDPLGRAVRTLAARRLLDAGTHSFDWDGADVSGIRLPRGVYLVRVTTGTQSVSGKVLLLE